MKQQYSELKDIQTGHAVFALKMALREIDNLVKNGMTKEDFEATRIFLRSYMKLYIQTPERQLGYMMDSRFYGNERSVRFLKDGATAADRPIHERVGESVISSLPP